MVPSLSLIRACFVLFLVALTMVSCGVKEPELDKIPPRYREMHMPQGWWTDSNVITEGKEIYDRLADPEAPCASCHGRDGVPIVTGARNLKDVRYANKMTDSYMYWRIATGVPKTKMSAWKDKLTEEQIWKAVAYIHTFSHGGKAEPHSH